MCNAQKISRSRNNLCCVNENTGDRRSMINSIWKLTHSQPFSFRNCREISVTKKRQSESSYESKVATGAFFSSLSLCLHVHFDAHCEHFYDGMICMYMTARQDHYCNAGNRDDVDFNFNDKCWWKWAHIAIGTNRFKTYAAQTSFSAQFLLVLQILLKYLRSACLTRYTERERYKKNALDIQVWIGCNLLREKSSYCR